MLSLEDIAENQDIFQRHLLPYLPIVEVVRLQRVSTRFGSLINDESCWKILSERDFEVDNKAAPEYNPHTKSFDNLTDQENFKKSYQQWAEWRQQTCFAIEPRHMIQSIGLWSRCKAVLRKQNLDKIVESLMPPPSREFFEVAAETTLPSSLLAFYAIHAGQSQLTPRSSDDDFFAGLFGSYSCYNSFFSMRLFHVSEAAVASISNSIWVVGLNLGMPRTFLVLDLSNVDEGLEGSMYFGYQGMNHAHLVCQGGILSYFETYVERLESSMYTSCIIHPDSPTSLGLSLFPETGDTVSVAVSHGVEVRASARWFPERTYDGPMNFGYSIRITLAESDSDSGEVSCQLVGRNWEFRYEDGTVNRVQGEGCIGKQPLFFRNRDGTSGYIDLGPAGTGEANLNSTFRYQSQSGPVPGTSSNNVAKTTNCRVKGTFSFRPGSIEEPNGSLFFVTVGEFPLRVPMPFY
ncbi:unnamed protein product [Pseudo-nitzschia multistriata]|uniref:ApaG domain-containing protein n=1 Tax=Pseudo-nitzschia multistriata TaxID=183589 RepID=A0A448Z6E2_9STRA|nr:unnamed protein product [Pseudo-nitzschia multistriata]